MDSGTATERERLPTSPSSPTYPVSGVGSSNATKSQATTSSTRYTSRWKGDAAPEPSPARSAMRQGMRVVPVLLLAAWLAYAGQRAYESWDSGASPSEPSADLRLAAPVVGRGTIRPAPRPAAVGGGSSALSSDQLLALLKRSATSPAELLQNRVRPSERERALQALAAFEVLRSRADASIPSFDLYAWTAWIDGGPWPRPQASQPAGTPAEILERHARKVLASDCAFAPKRPGEAGMTVAAGFTPLWAWAQAHDEELGQLVERLGQLEPSLKTALEGDIRLLGPSGDEGLGPILMPAGRR